MRRDVLPSDAVAAFQTESAKPSPKHDEGAICVRWVRCGRSWCRCMQGGPKHGPYYARYWWRDGQRYKRYVRQDEAEKATAACSARRQAERDERIQAEAARQAWREIRALIREVERGE
jgi:Family of unknown function (DUF6788)